MATDTIDKLQTATDEALDQLKNAKFWTDRRDAADALTDGAVGTAASLKQMLDDPDMDVRAACQKCFDRLRDAMDMPQLRHTESASASVTRESVSSADRPPLDEMVRDVGSQSGRSFRPYQEGYEIICKMTSGRQQKVYVRTGQKDSSGDQTIQVFSTCAQADEHVFRWALETNCKLRLGALAVTKTGDRDMFVLMNTHLEDGLMPNELEADVTYIAETADWIEQQLTGGDTH